LVLYRFYRYAQLIGNFLVFQAFLAAEDFSAALLVLCMIDQSER
jgi:hypothetical protein